MHKYLFTPVQNVPAEFGFNGEMEMERHLLRLWPALLAQCYTDFLNIVTVKFVIQAYLY